MRDKRLAVFPVAHAPILGDIGLKSRPRLCIEEQERPIMTGSGRPDRAARYLVSRASRNPGQVLAIYRLRGASMITLAVERRAIAERRVMTVRVVPIGDCHEHDHLRLRLAAEPTPTKDPALEGREDALGHRVVARITDRANRGHHAVQLRAARNGCAARMLRDSCINNYPLLARTAG